MENESIPFPDQIRPSNAYELERLFLAGSTIPHFEQLPTTITSGNLLTYAKWLDQLTQADPLHRERGAIILLNRNTNKLAFPTKPVIGDENSVTTSITRDTLRFSLVAHIHSHPAVQAFSPEDLAVLISGVHQSRVTKHPVSLVSSKGFTFLTFTTSETIWENPEVITETTESLSSSFIPLCHDNFQTIINLVAKELGIHSRIVYNYYSYLDPQKIQDHWNGVGLLASLQISDFLAERYRLGFYFTSEESNTFCRITTTLKDDIFTSLLVQELVKSVYKNIYQQELLMP